MDNVDSIDEKISEIKETISRNRDKDEMLLLEEAIRSFENEMYFASTSLFRTFIEKLFRDILIQQRLSNPESNETYDSIEQHYEDQVIKRRPKYNFNAICNELKEHDYLDTEDIVNFKKLYDIIRIPVQHGLYRRFMERRGKEIAYNKLPIHSKDLRHLTLPIMLRSVSIASINGIHEIITKLPKHFN